MTIPALDVLKRKDAESRTDYFCSETQHAGSEDYYVGAIDDLGGSAWVGGMAKRLGLDGPVQAKDLGAVLQGINPATGEMLNEKRLPKEPWMAQSGGFAKLTESEKRSATASWAKWVESPDHTFDLVDYVAYTQSKFLEDKELERTPKQPKMGKEDKVAYELTLNVDKSISAYYVVSDDETKTQIAQALNASADSLVAFAVERGYIKVRRGKGGGTSIPAEEVLAARFLHCTSRDLDPHLHVHLELSAQARAEGRNSAIEPEELYKRQKELAYVYDVFLAEQLQEIGLRCEVTKDGVAIPGQPEELLKNWSSRRNAIVAEMEKGHFGRKGNVRAWRATRSTKEQDIDQAELFANWRAEAARYTDIEEMKAAGMRTAGEDILVNEVPTEQIEELLLDNASVFREQDWDRLAAKWAIGHGGSEAIDEVKRRISRAVNVRHVSGEYYTTERMWQMERAIMSSAIGRSGEKSHSLDPRLISEALSKYPTMRSEQINAVQHMLGEGGINIVEGAAGTGKSFSLRVVGEAYEKAGYTVTGLAPSGTAASELQDGSGIQSGTLSSFLLRLERNKASLGLRDVLVLDEAGMVSSPDLARLVDAAHTAGAKVIMTGDSKQLEAVGTGNLLTQIKDKIGSADLTQIARQKGGRRQISDLLFAGKGSKALDALSNEIPKVALPENATLTSDTPPGDFAASWELGHFLKVRGGSDVGVENEKIQTERAKRGAFVGKTSVRDGERWFYTGEPVRISESDVNLGITQDDYATISAVTSESLTLSLEGIERTLPREALSKVEHAYAVECLPPKIFEAKNASEAIGMAAIMHIENVKEVGVEEALLLADTNSQVDALNDSVRKHLLDKGILDRSHAELCTWETAEGEKRKEVFMVGDRVMFRKNDKERGVYNGTTGTLVDVHNNNLRIRPDGQEEIQVNLSEYGDINIAWAMTTHKSQGMTVEKATHLTTGRTDIRMAYVGYTRARQGADFVASSAQISDLRETIDKAKAKHTTISLSHSEERPTYTATASTAIQPELASAKSSVLPETYRAGVETELTKRYQGPKVAVHPKIAAAVERERRRKKQGQAITQ